MDPETTSATNSPGSEPEKYIRTLEGDIDIVQRGGTPGLAPLKARPSERLIEASPIIEKPAATAPEPLIVEPTPVPPKQEEVMPAPIETYSDDFRQRLSQTHASTVSVLAAEQDAGPHLDESLSTPPPETHNRWYIVAGVLLVIVGAVGVYITYSKYLAATTPVVAEPAGNAPIFVDSTEEISGSGSALIQAIVLAVAKPLSQNSVAQLALASATSTDNVFLSLGIPVPGIVVRNITAKGNLAGVVNASGTQSPFFILSVDLYSATFSGMLTWEPTMQKDMKTLFPLPAMPAMTQADATSSAVTATGTATAPIGNKKLVFHDETVSNHDVRIYRDALGRSVLLYGYWNPNTLVIARDPIAFGEILDRLATSRAQ